MTAYTKTNWHKGNTITSTKMNNIETGVENANNDVATLASDTVRKSVTANGTQAQSQYNLVTNKITTGAVTSTVWNESSGGGFQVKNTNANIVSFIGVNNGQNDSDIWAQFYAKFINEADGQTKNLGTRVNFTNHGVYYTKDKTSGAYTADDELVTKATTNALEARIAALEAKVNS
jgi:hypothetical protein